MATYKWMLRKGGKKEICPQCGKRRFVPYVLTADGVTPAGPEYGRCDREQSCGYQRYPSYSPWIESKPLPKVEVKREPILFPAAWCLTEQDYTKNSLFIAFKDLLGADNLKAAMRKYRVMTGANGECIFPQYDGWALRTAKAIMYDSTGHRLKGDDGESLPVWWLHKDSSVAEYVKGKELKQCFFGQHLLAEYPDYSVWVVESEKTAILMSVENEHVIFIACGGSQMLKGAIDLSVLKGRDVTLAPDDGQYWNWRRVAEAHKWDVLEWDADNKGDDIWDYNERRLRNEIR